MLLDDGKRLLRLDGNQRLLLLDGDLRLLLDGDQRLLRLDGDHRLLLLDGDQMLLDGGRRRRRLLLDVGLLLLLLDEDLLLLRLDEDLLLLLAGARRRRLLDVGLMLLAGGRDQSLLLRRDGDQEGLEGLGWLGHAGALASRLVGGRPVGGKDRTAVVRIAQEVNGSLALAPGMAGGESLVLLFAIALPSPWLGLRGVLHGVLRALRGVLLASRVLRVLGFLFLLLVALWGVGHLVHRVYDYKRRLNSLSIISRSN